VLTIGRGRPSLTPSKPCAAVEKGINTDVIDPASAERLNADAGGRGFLVTIIVPHHAPGGITLDLEVAIARQSKRRAFHSTYGSQHKDIPTSTVGGVGFFSHLMTVQSEPAEAVR
jgi:hypothetical protein